MRTPVQITALEEQKVWGMLPREITYNAAGVMGVLALGFVVAAVLSHVWWFLAGTALAGITATALVSVTFHLKRLAYASADRPGGE